MIAEEMQKKGCCFTALVVDDDDVYQLVQRLPLHKMHKHNLQYNFPFFNHSFFNHFITSSCNAWSKHNIILHITYLWCVWWCWWRQTWLCYFFLACNYEDEDIGKNVKVFWLQQYRYTHYRLLYKFCGGMMWWQTLCYAKKRWSKTGMQCDTDDNFV